MNGNKILRVGNGIRDKLENKKYKKQKNTKQIIKIQKTQI